MIEAEISLKILKIIIQIFYDVHHYLCSDFYNNLITIPFFTFNFFFIFFITFYKLVAMKTLKIS